MLAELNSLVFMMAVVGLAYAWWYARNRRPAARPAGAPERVDTLIGWPPEPTRILRRNERLAYSTLKLALPGYMILAQVPIARFISVPKRNYAEWLNRLGHQCVDFAVCDATSQVVAVVEIKPPAKQMTQRMRRRIQRIERALNASQIQFHVWTEDELPTVDAARAEVLPNGPAAARVAVAATAPTTATAAAAAASADALADSLPEFGHDWTGGIEVSEPPAASWFDELEATLAPVPSLSLH